MNNIQNQFDRCTSNVYVMPEGDYQGPLKITRTCVVDGSGSSLWAGIGPTLLIEAPGVTIKNLKVRAIGKPDDKTSQIAIKSTQGDTKLENVEISGNLDGFPNEADTWLLPNILPMGKFAAEKQNNFAVRINAASDAELSTDIQGLTIIPPRLVKGDNIFTIQTDGLRDNTLIYGSLFVKTGVVRKICITGKAQIDAPMHDDGIQNTQAAASAPQQASASNNRTTPPPQRQTSVQNNQTAQSSSQQTFVSNARANQQPVQATPPQASVSPLAEDENVTYIRAGQRISLKEIQDSLFRIAYFHNGTKKELDMDGYVFMLGANGKVIRDENMIFFGNEESADHAVKVTSNDKMPVVLLDLSKVDSSVEKIAVTYSIYGNEPSMNFSLIEEPVLRIFSGAKEYYRFKLEGLNLEKTVVAAEIYRYKGEWKISFVGGGYNNGLRHLCESFGVHIE